MRLLWNNLGDPGLHLLAIALIMAYLAFARGSWPGEVQAEAPLPICQKCHGHYLPGTTCTCQLRGHYARALN